MHYYLLRKKTCQIISAVSIVPRVRPVMMRSFASIQTCLTKKHFKNRNHIHIITKPCIIISIRLQQWHLHHWELFCYGGKVIFKQEIYDSNQIRNEQKDFDNKLYTSTKLCINTSHRDIFFNDNNPFTIKPGTDKVNSFEGLLTIRKCLAFLKIMKNCK